MSKQLRILMIGPHPDDCDIRCGGTALKYVQAGHTVKFISTLDGSGGHQTMKPAEIAERRRGETQRVAEYAGITYDVWDIPDCELMADLETRKRLIRDIRKFNPDVIFCCRPNDYHADHRNCSILVQDASYLLIVPNFCPEVPPMREMPVILYFEDNFQNPPFQADIVVAIDDVIDRKFGMLDLHVSQMYEWLPYTRNQHLEVPADAEGRMKWLRGNPIPRDCGPLTMEQIKEYTTHSHSEGRYATPAVKYYDRVVARYGEEKAHDIRFAEVFELCEYGKQMTPELEKELFPF